MSAPAISQHLKVLRETNVVEMEKRAQQRLYRINPATLTEMENWVHELKRRWEERFEALDKILEQEKSKQDVGRAVETAATRDGIHRAPSVPADNENKDKTPKGRMTRRKKDGKQK
jgi:hypothetical protein